MLTNAQNFSQKLNASKDIDKKTISNLSKKELKSKDKNGNILVIPVVADQEEEKKEA